MMRRVALVLLMLLVSAYASAERFVVVNGIRLNIAELEVLDIWACGYVNDGYYWYNLHNGYWGYWGNPVVQGQLTGNCANAAINERRKSLSERGLLYSPSEILSGR